LKSVGVLGWELPPFFAGGLGIHTLNLFSILGKILDITLYIPKFTDKDIHYNFKVKMVNYDPVGSPYERNKEFYQKVMDYNEILINEFDKDHEIIHMHDWITVPAGIKLKEKYRKKLVFTVHSTEYDRSGGFYPQERILKIEKEGMMAADRIIAVSHYTKKIISEKFSINPAKVTVIHNGVKSSLFSSFNKNYDLKNKVLYFGRVTPQKGSKFFIEAAYKVNKYIPSAEFIVAGEGDQLNEIKNFSKSLGLENTVNFYGFVSESESVRLYLDSDVFILPAVSEPFGMTVIESLSVGTPAIISKTTGVGEALNNVLKADFWDTDKIANYIIAVLKHRKLRETLGNFGKLEASRFSWENTALKTLEVYNSL